MFAWSKFGAVWFRVTASRGCQSKGIDTAVLRRQGGTDILNIKPFGEYFDPNAVSTRVLSRLPPWNCRVRQGSEAPVAPRVWKSVHVSSWLTLGSRAQRSLNPSVWQHWCIGLAFLNETEIKEKVHLWRNMFFSILCYVSLLHQCKIQKRLSLQEMPVLSCLF